MSQGSEAERSESSGERRGTRSERVRGTTGGGDDVIFINVLPAKQPEASGFWQLSAAKG
ncbi:hypothetical protein [Halorussus halophilus]|uniref:hypothetical protein n=1 Tax=Halorussus halophilus TaxID=2650975 RepID=UPI001787B242|nr:hypothetical protein [Halorussus halophilus]